MIRQSNIFYKLTSENENATTNLLCNLLEIKFFRDICLEYFEIPKDIYTNIQPTDIFTQHTIDDAGKPDICIKNNEVLYLIENKIHANTDLQNSQVTTYADHVVWSGKDLKNKGYIFIIPKGYKHEDDIKKAIIKYPFIKIFYWECFLKYLSEMELDNCSLGIKESLEYLRDLILGTPEDTTLNIYEVAAMYNPKDIYTVLNLLEKNIKHIIKVTDRLTEKLGDKFTVGSVQKNKFTQGRYLSYNDQQFFLGLSPCLAEENGDYVYSLAIEKKYVNLELIDSINKEKFPYFEDGGFIYIQIDRKLFLDESQEDKLLDRVIEIITEVLLEICKI